MSKTILVVDDEDNVREVTIMSLEVMGGYQTLAAASGAEAIEIAAQQQPDAILLDARPGPGAGPRATGAPGR